MSKFWLVFKYEYLRHVGRRRFIFALLSMPFFLAVMVGVMIIAIAMTYKGTPIGYVDEGNVFPEASSYSASKTDSLFPPVQVLRYGDVKSADQALQSKTIQAYYQISPDYMSTGKVTQISLEKPGDNIQDDFREFLRFNLLTSEPKPIADRLSQGSSFIVRSADGSRQMSDNEWMGFILPILSGVLFVIVINISGGYLLQAVVEEKENRTIEIVITSVSPNQLMAGKIAGNLSVGLTQLLVWIIFGVGALLVARQFIPDIQNINIPFDFAAIMLFTLLPAFVMVASMMAAVGATYTESREAQQIAGLFTLPVIVPFWFISSIMQAPNGPISVGMSLFPLTAPISLPLRAAFTNIPIWQEAVSLFLLVFCAIGALWIAGRAFRLGMLRYGKRLSWKELFGRA